MNKYIVKVEVNTAV